MDSNDYFLALLLLPSALGMLWLAYRIARDTRGLWMCSDRFNSTDGWTPAPPSAEVDRPSQVYGSVRHLRIITPFLEEGERLEGFAGVTFSPPRPRDWGYSLSIARHPLLMALTSRRMLLFELRPFKSAALRYRFVEYDSIRSLRPPRSLPLGMSGLTRFELSTGDEYQLGFYWPVADEEGLRQEQRLAAYLRWVAARPPSSEVARSLTSESAA